MRTVYPAADGSARASQFPVRSQRADRLIMGQKLELQPATAGYQPVAAGVGKAAGGADGSGGPGAADCLRQRGQPAAGPRRPRAAAKWPSGWRWGRAAGARAAISDREPGDRAGRRSGRAAGLGVDHQALLHRPAGGCHRRMDRRHAGRSPAPVRAGCCPCRRACCSGLAPALQAAAPNWLPRYASSQPPWHRLAEERAFRRILVVVQLALSLLLLVGAGLFARSLFNLLRVNPGFRTERLLTFSIDPALNGYTGSAASPCTTICRRGWRRCPVW